MSEIQAPAETALSGHTTRRLATRQRLLEAGTELFAEHGVHDVTSKAIASRAGVATGTFYLHFPDKHALFEALVNEALEEMRPQLAADERRERSAGEMRRDFERMLEVAERRRNLIRAVFDRAESTGLADRIRDRLAGHIEARLQTLFEQRGIALHAGAAAQARAAVLVRVIAWWAEDPSRARRDEIVETLMAFDPRRLGGEGKRVD